MAKKDEEKLVSSLAGVSDNTLAKLAEYQAGYQQGEAVTNAYNEYNNLKQNAPQAYVSPYQTQLDDLYQKITNRTPFKYNLNGDMLYQNAKEQYQQLGKQAMVDTMGQATQLTGGYGNSYAQNVGNQTYQQWLTKLNEQIPTYYNLARQRYADEGDELYRNYGLLNDREADAYSKYRDTVSDYNQNLSLAYNVYNNERDTDYGRHRDNLDYWQNQAGAENSDYWNKTQFDYQKEQDALNLAWQKEQFDREMAYRYAALNRSGRGSGGDKKGGNDGEPYADGTISGTISKLAANINKAGNEFADTVKNDAAVLNYYNPKINLHGIGGASADLSKVYDWADKQAANYTDERSFLTDLENTIHYYEIMGNFSKEQGDKIRKHYGLID